MGSYLNSVILFLEIVLEKIFLGVFWFAKRVYIIDQLKILDSKDFIIVQLINPESEFNVE